MAADEGAHELVIKDARTGKTVTVASTRSAEWLAEDIRRLEADLEAELERHCPAGETEEEDYQEDGEGR